MASRKNPRDTAVVVAGQAGQGIQTIEFILTRVLKRSGYHVFATKEYRSRIRGGQNSTLIRVGSERVRANVDRIDLLVALDEGALEHLEGRITPGTVVMGDTEKLRTECDCVDVPFAAIAEEAGGAILANTVAIAVLAGIFDADLSVLEDFVAGHFAAKGKKVVRMNVAAAGKGYAVGAELRASGRVVPSVAKTAKAADELLVSGAEAVSLGAVSGGCNFISAYPMSPGTAVLTYMARHDDLFGIAAEQAEDEIAAVNMALGAWFAGARAMVTTSGGGFSLMEEGVSLAGITETPLVIHIAQRPGPATGMATRTEQADLNLALFAGQGEFPRVIFAPGSMEEAFRLTHLAFETADRFQVPAFILTDQYLMDSYYSVPDLGVENLKMTSAVVRTTSRYRRYAFTGDGVSPRGVPGHGRGLVAADSHEHTEEGHITEDIDLRNRMMAKRMGKIDLLAAESLPPTVMGPGDAPILVVGWGSTFHILEEAVGLLERDDTAVVHYAQVYPLHRGSLERIRNARKVITVENNYTGQFGRLLACSAGREPDHSILQYDGRPFCSESLARRILKAAGRRVKS